jgi:hypothetical protein
VRSVRIAVGLAGLVLLLGAMTGAADAVTLLSDARMTLAQYARAHDQDPSLYEARYAATGMVICNGVYSTGQLTVRDDIVTTAAHAFFGPDGKPRGNLDACVFSVAADGVRRRIPFDVATLKVGTSNPYPLPPAQDWAVVRLREPVPGARPYPVADGAPAGTAIVLVAHRHRGWAYDGMRAIEGCRIRDEAAAAGDAAREIDIDCSAGDGASGSAIMLPGASCRMVGIYIGWRSSHPDAVGPYSAHHLNFGITVQGAFRNTILTLAGEEEHPAVAAAQAPASGSGPPAVAYSGGHEPPPAPGAALVKTASRSAAGPAAPTR